MGANAPSWPSGIGTPPKLGGSGGGRADFSQGGVESLEDINLVLSSLPEFILSLSS